MNAGPGPARSTAIRLSISTKMLVFFGGGVAVLLCVIMFTSLYGIPALGIQGDYGIHREEVIHTINEIADLKKAEMLHWFEERKGDIRTFSESSVVRRRLEVIMNDDRSRMREGGGAADPESLREYRDVLQHAEAIIKNYPDFSALSVVDLNTGRVIFSTAKGKRGADLSDDEAIRNAGFPGVGELIEFKKNKDAGEVFLRMLNPVSRHGHDEETGKPLLAALFDINLGNFLQPTLHTGPGLGSSGEVVLVDMNRFILAPLKYPLPGHVKAAPFEYRLATKPAELAAWGIDGQVFSTDYRGVDVIAAVRHIRITSEFGIGMIIKMDESEVLSFARRSLINYSVIAGIGLALMLGLISLLSRRIARPVIDLSRTAKQVMDGDLSARSSVSTGDEVGALAHAFNSMVMTMQEWQAELESKVRERTAALAESEERFRTLLERSFDGIFIHDRFIILDLNERMAEMSGYPRDELVQKNALAYFTPDSKKRIQEHIALGDGGPYHVELRRKDGHTVSIEAFGAPCKYQGRDAGIVALKDVTNQKRLEDQLRQSQKMEGVGQLAGGVAHDFNNILSAIIGYGHLTLMKMEKEDPRKLNIEHMLEAADRAAHLTQDLLLFSRKQPSDRKPCDVNEIVRKVETFLVRVIGEDIACKTRYHEGPIPVLADAHQVEQVLMNLATNARDAMPKGGSLTITTERVQLADGFMTAHGYGKPGAYALITVADTGSGMDEQTRRHIFEPFFTTKEVGKGTGLGLAVVYGIIRQHEGYVNVYSEPNQGTTFRIYLPLSASCVIEGKQAAVEERPVGGAETILLAEDDESLRTMTISALESFGYTVIAAVDGEDAVRLFRENQDRIGLLLLDLVMPKKTGKDAYDEIQKMRPGVKVVFTSGYAPDTVRDRVLLEQEVPIAYKPISPTELLKIVRSTLDAGENRSPGGQDQG